MTVKAGLLFWRTPGGAVRVVRKSRLWQSFHHQFLLIVFHVSRVNLFVADYYTYGSITGNYHGQIFNGFRVCRPTHRYPASFNLGWFGTSPSNYQLLMHSQYSILTELVNTNKRGKPVTEPLLSVKEYLITGRIIVKFC